MIGDVTLRAERGGLMGIFGGGGCDAITLSIMLIDPAVRMFGQAFGPVIGGALAQFLGFRYIGFLHHVFQHYSLMPSHGTGPYSGFF